MIFCMLIALSLGDAPTRSVARARGESQGFAYQLATGLG
jgi:hypothetical protein